MLAASGTRPCVFEGLDPPRQAAVLERRSGRFVVRIGERSDELLEVGRDALAARRGFDGLEHGRVDVAVESAQRAVDDEIGEVERVDERQSVRAQSLQQLAQQGAQRDRVRAAQISVLEKIAQGRLDVLQCEQVAKAATSDIARTEQNSTVCDRSTVVAR